MTTFNDARVRKANAKPVNSAGKYVLYWCQMSRRLTANHALDYAIHWANQLKRPLVVYEALRLDYPWASARFHQFMLEGMRDNAIAAAARGFTYWPFVETPARPARGLVRKLCESACVLVTDDYPQFIVPAQIRAVAGRVNVAVHAIDGNGMIPLSLLGAPVGAAAHLRPRMHKQFADAWAQRAIAEPIAPPRTVAPPFDLWVPPADLSGFVKSLPIDQSVPAVPGTVGGSVAGRSILAEFAKRKLRRYADERSEPNDPDSTPSSGLSPYLHYGHLGIQEVCEAVLGKGWMPAELNRKTRNKDDFFTRDPNANGFLDEAITWRDVGFQWSFNRRKPTDDRPWADGIISKTNDSIPSFNFASEDFAPLPAVGTLDGVLPPWAKASLANHAADRRSHLYTLEQFEHADTHDELWNAGQRELVASGRMHNYMRMLWAKKVLEWSATPEEAYRILEHLNNKYATDGRDPNSYTGILWCFGLFDRPWPPERAVFGNVRYMSSDMAAKKFDLSGYFDYVKRLPSIASVRAGMPSATRPANLFATRERD